MMPRLICLVRTHKWHSSWDDAEQKTVWTSAAAVREGFASASWIPGRRGGFYRHNPFSPVICRGPGAMNSSTTRCSEQQSYSAGNIQRAAWEGLVAQSIQTLARTIHRGLAPTSPTGTTTHAQCGIRGPADRRGQGIGLVLRRLVQRTLALFRSGGIPGFRGRPTP